MTDNYLDRLVTARQRAWGEAKSIIEQATAENRDMTAEERQTFERIEADLDEKDAHIKSVRDHLANEREADIARDAYAPFLGDTSDRNDDTFDAFLRGNGARAMDIDFTAIAAEKRAIRNGASGRELRDLVVGTTTAGGHTVPTDLVRSIYQYMENVSGVRRAGATVITTAGGNNLDLPQTATSGTAAIVGEGTALAENDPTFGKITLGAYKYGQLLQASNELLADSGVDLVGFFGRQFGTALGRATESHYVTGTGTNQPQGAARAAIVGTGVTLQTVATGVPSYANLVSLVYSVDELYRSAGAGWLMQDSFAGVIRKIVDTTGRPIWEPSTQAGQPDRLLGYPVYTTPFLSAVGTAAGTPMAFGSFAEGYIIRDVGSVRIERSDEYAFANDLVSWRAVLRTDGRVQDARAIKVALAPTT